MKEIDEIYESLLFSIPQNNLGTEYKYGFQQGIALFKKVIDNSTVFSGKTSAQPEMVENLPTADPEIIRCKDCLMHGVCRFEQGLGLDGYCSQAERRTDE